MNDKIQELPVPMNATEKLLYAQVVRLNAVCDMLSSIVEVMAKQQDIAVEDKVIVEKTPAKRKSRAKKTTPKEV